MKTLILLHYTNDSTGEEYVVFSEDGDVDGNLIPGFKLYSKAEIETIAGDFSTLPIDVTFALQR